MGGTVHRALAVAQEQAGALSMRQALALGLTRSQVAAAVTAGRWRRALPGVFVVFTGPMPSLTRVWCAQLFCGPGAVAAGRTALWLLDGAGRDEPLPHPIELYVPHGRRVRAPRGVVVRRRRDLDRSTASAGTPRRTRLEATVLDLADRAGSEEGAVDVVLRVIQRRLTTARRLRAELAARARHRRRGLLTDMLAEVDDGVTTPLELRYARDVERAHGLPAAQRNRPEGRSGRRRYRNNRYLDFGLLVELDGEEAHPPEEAYLDRRRDNAVVVVEQGTLRYGWRDVTGRRCLTADEVGAALAHRGWTGRPTPCGPDCRLRVSRARTG